MSIFRSLLVIAASATSSAGLQAPVAPKKNWMETTIEELLKKGNYKNIAASYQWPFRGSGGKLSKSKDLFVGIPGKSKKWQPNLHIEAGLDTFVKDGQKILVDVDGTVVCQGEGKASAVFCTEENVIAACEKVTKLVAKHKKNPQTVKAGADIKNLILDIYTDFEQDSGLKPTPAMMKACRA